MRNSGLLVTLLALIAVAAARNLLPGVERGHLGYNIVEDRYALTAVKVTFDLEQTIVSPYDGITYAIPDQIDPFGVRTTKASQTYSANSFSKLDQYTKSTADAFNISLDVPDLFEFSRATANKKLVDNLKFVDQRYILSGESHSYFAINLLPAELMEPSDALMKLIDKTGRKFVPESESNFRTWRNIFQYFGTYYSNSFVLGGKVVSETFLNVTHLKNHSTEYILDQIGFKFGADSNPSTNEQEPKYFIGRSPTSLTS